MIDKRIKDYFERKPNASYLIFCLHDIFVSCFLELVCK